MFRRYFMQRITGAGAALFAGRQGSQPRERKTVTYKIKGFTCVTCAVGLETMLKQEKNILRAAASYPQSNLLIEFDPALVTETSLKEFIRAIGFEVEVTGAK